MFPRKQYLEKLIKKRDNGRVKVITAAFYLADSSAAHVQPYAVFKGEDENEFITLRFIMKII